MFRTFPTVAGRVFSGVFALIALAAPASRAEIIINEIMYFHGSGIPEQTGEEFIEILNTGPTAVDLTGYRFDRGISFTFPSVSLEAGALFVIAADPALHPTLTNVGGPWTGKLSNSGENIRLLDATGVTVDSVAYSDQGDWARRVTGPFDNGHRGWDWISAADGNGSSLELVNPALSNNAGSNWLASLAPGGSPGTANSVAASDVAPLIRKVAHSPALPTSSAVVVIEADITDEQAAAASATLHWRISSTSPGTFDSLTMSAPSDPADTTYRATLNAQPDGTVIEFYIRASDGTNSRTWPAATNTGQNANALFQFNDEAYAGRQGIYRLVMSGQEDAEFTSIDRDSNAQMNTTLIADDGSGPIIRYLCGTRVRGASSRSDDPFPLRVNLPRDAPWNGSTEMNLNTQFTYLQFIGLKLLQSSKLAAADSLPVQVRRNGVNLATEEEQYGSYVHVQPLGGEFIDDKFPDDNRGNLYKKVRPDNSWAYRGNNVAAYLNDGWSKSTNTSENDWGDLDHFLLTMLDAQGAPDYVAQIEAVADLDQWMRWFAAMTLLANGETNASNGADDDYSLYSSGIDGRFQFVAHDLDTILGQGDRSRITNPQHTLFDMIQNDEVLEPLIPLFQNPTIRARYFIALRGLIQTSFSKRQFDALLNNHLGSWVPNGVITAAITFMDARRSFVEATINAELGPPPPPTAPTTVGELTSGHGDLMISEILAVNESAFANGTGFPDVIELHNAGASAIDLGNMAISDDPAAPGKFVFPAGTMIEAGGYLLLFADSDIAAPGIHLGFSLDGQGEGVYLSTSAAGGSPTDSVTFGPQIADLSVSRTGATLDTWKLTAPTIGSANGAGLIYGDPASLRINEWLASPEVRFADEFIELYNPDAAPVALGLMRFTDNAIYASDPVALPELSFIAPGAYAVFETLGNLAQPGSSGQLPFKLRAPYDWLSISAANGIEIDKVHFNNQYADISSGRLPDGSDNIQTLAFPTPGQSNNNQPVTTIAEVMPVDSIWAYEQSNTDLGATAWREPAPFYDDSTWPRGQGILARENSTLPFPIRTALNLNPPTTHYFRQEFSLTAAQAVGTLIYESIVDDGAVFYVNGNELSRLRMPSGIFNHGSFASSSKGNASVEGPFPIPIEFLNAGTNLFAVEVHQQDSDSSDVAFGMRITATSQSIADPAFARLLDLLNGLRITELMYAPPGGRTHEFVELRNIGPVPLDLEGVRFTDAIAYTFPQMTLAPGEFVVVVPDQAAFAAQYGAGINVAAGNYTGAFSNGGERVQLTLPAPSEAAILSFDYNNTWLPATDGNGRSMVIADSTRAPRTWDQRASWIASVVDGGSPGGSGPTRITSSLGASGTEGFPFNYQIAAANNPISFSASGLVPGLGFNPATGLISGTPSTDGTFAITIGAAGTASSDSQTLTLTLAPQPAPQITSTLAAQAVLSIAYSYRITASNNPSSFSASGLPEWLTLDPATGVLAGVPDAVGGSTITITATNFGGSDTQMLVLNSVTDPIATAIDSSYVSITQGGDADWFAQTEVTHDGIDAAASGNISNEQSSWMEATITGPDRLSFFWKVSSQACCDSLRLTMDGAQQFQIAGEIDWQERQLDIPAGTHTIRWEYVKDDSLASGQDRAWLDQISLENADPTPSITSPLTASARFGNEFSYQITASNNPTDFAASPLPRGLSINRSTGLISGTPSLVGNTVTTITASNPEGSGSAQLSFEILSAQGDLFDNPHLVWNFSGGSDWREQTEDTHDGIDAAKSGNIGSNQNSTMFTTVSGPAMLSFWWKVESEQGFDFLTFFYDGRSSAAISGFTGWRQVFFPIDSGFHTLQWTFRKDGNTSHGEDSGWVDEIVIEAFDNDSDGLEDRWELATFGNLDQDADSDTDGDGASNAEEFIADTLPQDPASNFKIISIDQRSDGSRKVSWVSSQRRSYIVQASNDLGQWADVSQVIRGGPGVTSTTILPEGVTFSEVEIVPELSPLKATVPGSNIGSLWQGGDEAAFAATGGDSTWISGTRGVGYENGSGDYAGFYGIDLLGLMRNLSSTAYMRIPFTIEDPDNLAGLILQMRYDDAFVAYINGVEVARSSAVPATLHWQSEATTGSRDDNTDLVGFDIITGIDALKPGPNLLAIHALNAGNGSSDFLMVPRVLGTAVDFSNRTPPSDSFLRVLVFD